MANISSKSKRVKKAKQASSKSASSTKDTLNQTLSEIANALADNLMLEATPSINSANIDRIEPVSYTNDTLTLTQTLTVSQSFKLGHELHPALDAITFQGKNLFQCTLFVTKQVVTSFEQGQLKPVASLHENQLRVLEQVNHHILQINQARTERFNSDKPARGPTRLDAAGNLKPKELKLLPLYQRATDYPITSATVDIASDISESSSSSINTATAFDILDITLLDNVMRNYTDHLGRKPYAELPSTIASAIVRQVIGIFETWFKALQGWQANPNKFSGGKRPQLPKYKSKDSRLALKLALANLNTNLPNLDIKDLCSDFDKTQPVSLEDKRHWNEFNIEEFISQCRAKAHYPDAAEAVSIRIVPKSSKINIEVVFNVPYTLPADCLLLKLEAEARALLYKEVIAKVLKDSRGGCKTEEQAVAWLANPANKKWTTYTQRRLDAKVKKLLKNLKEDELPSIAGLDMGLSNVVTIAYAPSKQALAELASLNSHINPEYYYKSSVISNQRHEAELLKLDLKLDKLKASLLSEATRLLQSRMDKEEELTKEEYRQLQQGLNAAYATPEYRKLSEQRQQVAKDFLHKLSHDIIEELVAKRTQVLCIGKNVGWKDEVDMGKRMNRRMYRTSHAQLIELLQYKARMAGIVVVLTEESYSSKSSFRLNEKLRIKDSDMEGESHQSLGTRNKSESWFTSKGTDLGKWWRIHDDVNGAFNIIRKVFKHFKWCDKLSPLINIMWLSPKSGLTRACLKPKITAKSVMRWGLVESKLSGCESVSATVEAKGNNCSDCLAI